MKIGIDLTYIESFQNVDGVRRYALSLLKGWQAVNKLEHFILLVNGPLAKEAKELFPEAKVAEIKGTGLEKKALELFNNHTVKKVANDLYKYWVMLPRVIDLYGCDILFYPFSIVSLRILSKIPNVVTVHDLYFKNFPGHLRTRYLNIVDNRYRYFFHEADSIITISNFVTNDILKHYPEIDRSKIAMIYNPVLMDNPEEDFFLQSPYILSLNAIRRHKNLLTLVKAYHLIADQVDHSLVLAGNFDAKNDEVNKYILNNNLQDRVYLTGYINENIKRSLYKNASLFISTSLHEGFGLTPIEAMLMEVPVITTLETSLPEVTGGLAFYYEPADDYNKLAEKIIEVLHNPPEKKDLIKTRNHMLDKYNPAKAAEAYWDLFMHIYSKSL